MTTTRANAPVPPGAPVSVLGPLTAAIGLGLLALSLFFDWYLIDIVRPMGGLEDRVSLTAWRAFEMLDAALLLLAIGGAGAVIAQLRRPSVGGQWALTAVGSTAVVLVVVQLIDGPPAPELLIFVDPEEHLRAGAWLALAGAALTFTGGVVTLAGSDGASRTSAHDAGSGTASSR